MGEKVPILLLTSGSMNRLGRRFRGMGKFIGKAMPNLSQSVVKAGIEADPESYAVGSFFSSLIYGMIFFVVSLAALAPRNGFVLAMRPSLGIGLGMFSVFFLLHLVYPGILVRKVASKESKDLLFALREIMTDVGSGVPLFDSMKNVGQGGYGYVSRDFEWAMKLVESGVPETTALKQLALKTESEYLKRAVWQIVNALESGARMESALTGIVESLENYIYRDIRNYSSNLNFLMLMYMLAAAVVPSLGITFLILLSAFGGLGVNLTTVGVLLGLSVVIQLAMMGYMTVTRPEIFGG